MCLVFFTKYLDKQSLAHAAVYGLIEDLDLSDVEYSWRTSGFYLTQLFTEFIFIYAMSRLPIAQFIGGTIIAWGAICCCLAAPHNFAGILVARYFLGFAEAAVSPAFITITSIWYRKEEHPLRVGMWVTCNDLAQIIGSLLMHGIGRNGSLSIAHWRVLFLGAGAITTFAGVIFYIAMPAGPHNAWFLTAEEKILAEKRLASQHDGGDTTSF